MKATGIRIVLIVLAHAFIICAGDSDASSRSEKKSKGVTTFVSAKWEATPLVLELAEYMSGESADLFWSYFDGIISLKSSLSGLGKQTFNSYSVNESGSCPQVTTTEEAIRPVTVLSIGMALQQVFYETTPK